MATTMLWSFLVSILFLVTIHEFGHYWVARKCGVAIEKFSIGFGPTILTWTNKEGTEFVLAAIPLGGFVKMRGEYQIATDEKQSEPVEGSFASRTVWQRMAIVLAGPLANLLFAALVLIGLNYGEHTANSPVVSEPAAGSLAAPLGLRSGDVVETLNGKSIKGWNEIQMGLFFAVFDREPIALSWRNTQGQVQQGVIDTHSLNVEQKDWQQRIGLEPTINKVLLGDVQVGSAAQTAGLQNGDEVVSINGQRIASPQGMVEWVSKNANQSLSMAIVRAGVPQTINVTPKDGKLGVQITADTPKTTYHNGIFAAAQEGVSRTMQMTWLNTKAVAYMLTGQLSLKNIGGPVATARVTGEGVSQGWAGFLATLAMISIGLGALNLLPIPVLDGGHLVYYLFEAVVGRPVSERALAIGQRVGLALLLGFMGIAFFNDGQSLFG
ncbi:MAG: RIP metalloprotease RseP [Formosimonas sp.]